MIDEKAFQAALAASGVHAGSAGWLRTAIEAYEQARERASVLSREEIAAGLSTAYQASELNADEALEFDDIPEDERKRHLWMADYVLTLLRQAPSAQPGSTTSVSDIASKLRWAYDHTDRTPGSKDDPWESVAESAIKLLANATVASAQSGDSERYRHAVQRSDEHGGEAKAQGAGRR